jgi:hypothetical protein
MIHATRPAPLLHRHNAAAGSFPLENPAVPV